MATSARLVPNEHDVDTEGFWAAARQHRLVVRRCVSCETVLHMPRAYCRNCGSWDTQWVAVSGRGHLFSWTVVEHQVHPGFPVPYTVVLVELDDAPAAHLVGHLPGAPELVGGQAMEVWFEELDDGVTLPQWKPVP
jgi:uncharacterized OB-fold protein